MKALYRISLFINFIGLVFLLIKGGELLAKSWDTGEPGLPEKVYATAPTGRPSLTGTEGKAQAVNTGMELPATAATPEPVRETAAQELTTSCDTVCHVLRSDLTDGSERESICEIPSAYIGKTREQLMQLIDLYNQSPPLEEQNVGFVSMELVAFSRSDLTVRKVYESNPFYCCIVVEDNFLTVYDSSRENVLLYTDISLDSLPEQLAQEVMDGKYMKTQQQLYDFLESYSS